MNARLYQAMQTNPIIAAIRDDAGLEGCLKADVQIVFVLYGDICSIAGIVERIKDAGKMAIVHVDLITGLSGKEICVDFLRNATRADGIISTRANMIQRAKELQMITVFRVFVIDSMALDSLLGVKNLRPDAIDILPGLMPGIICKVRTLTGLPVLAGGAHHREAGGAAGAGRRGHGHFQHGSRRLADVGRSIPPGAAWIGYGQIGRNLLRRKRSCPAANDSVSVFKGAPA